MSRRTPSIAQRSSLGRTAARAQAAAVAEAAPATAPAAGVEVRMYGRGALVAWGSAKTPDQVVNTTLIKDCWKETARGLKSRAQFEAFCKSQGIRVQWLNLDGGGVNCILYLVMGKNKRVRQIQCQYLHGQNHFNKAGKISEGFGVPELLYVDADGKLAARFADGVRTPALLRIHHAAPEAAISVRSLLGDLAALAELDSTSPRSEKNWVACSSKGLVGFNRGSVGTAFLDYYESVQKSLALEPTKAAVAPYIDMRAADAPEQFKHVLESQLTLALSALRAARAGSPLVSKLFLRERTKTLGPFDTPEAKGAAEKIAFDKLETLQCNLVAASSRRGLVVAPTKADAHLSKLAVKPLAFQSEKAASPTEAVTRLRLSFQVFDACTRNCHFRGPCSCTDREWRSRGKLVKMTTANAGIKLHFDDKGKDVTIKDLSQINERLKPASGNGDALPLVRKAARAAVRAGWKAPPGLASLTRGRGG